MGAQRLTLQEEARIRRLRKEGHTLREIARIVGRSWSGIRLVELRPASPVPEPVEVFEPRPGRLRLVDREEIVVGLIRGDTFTAIAAHIGRHVSTVSREVSANGGRGAYRASVAHAGACRNARRPKPRKLACPSLAGLVREWLLELWSPEEIARRLRLEFPDDPMMWVSHETIYQTLYVQGRGELRRELHRCLRSGRADRRPQGRPSQGGHIKDMVMISERPAEAEDRAVPGHWEGDLLIGKDGKSAIVTLVERSTRYVMLGHIGGRRTAPAVRDVVTTLIQRLPTELVRTLTWDQGREMAHHAGFTVDTGVQVYFCDPHSPWQRGSNENTNGLLRQYFPKGMALSAIPQDKLDAVARQLNGRPRKTLDFLKPSEKMAELVALTD